MISMSRMLRVGAIWPVVSVLLLLAACSSGDDGTSTVFAPATPDAPSPTETVIDVSGAMAGELDLSHLPDDPTELMLASLEEPLD